MKEFGNNFYESYVVYFNFDKEDELKSIFEINRNPQRIVELLSLLVGKKTFPILSRFLTTANTSNLH